MSQKLIGVPRGGEVWSVGAHHYIVYSTPHKGVPIAYRLAGSDQLNELFDGSPQVVRRFSGPGEAGRATGMMIVGHRDEITNSAKHPFRTLHEKYNRMVQSQPWMADPEVMGLYAAATLEGRTISEQELASTRWFRNRTRGEREWAVLQMADPSTATQQRRERRTMVDQTLRELGVNNAPDKLIDFLTNQWITGKWSQEFVTEQLRAVADPFRKTLHRSVRQVIGSFDLDTTREHEDTVRNQVAEWLGPHVAANWSDRQISRWAGRLRNDPDAHQDLTETLRRQRLAKYQEYQDPNTTYAEIDALWRPLVHQMWGEDPNPEDSIYERILQINNSAEAEKILRGEGLKRNNRNVGLNLLSQLHDALGGSVREMA